MMIVDATNQLVGRMATRIAKAALNGETIHIVNCEKAVISGNTRFILAKFDNRAKRGTPAKGPFIPKRPNFLVKRIIRGMLPYKTLRGSEALARIRCYSGVPAAFQGKTFDKIEGASVDKLKMLKFTPISRITQFIGGRTQ
ncbi:MAG TPA: 50S ribosomal protein L13 [Acidobacteriota bacterium]|nr:50S ribosomal protein L13 [Acidobacteriota bacterium]